jgi:hypothetical protein
MFQRYVLVVPLFLALVAVLVFLSGSLGVTAPIVCSSGFEWRINSSDRVYHDPTFGNDIHFQLITLSLLKDGTLVFDTGSSEAFSPSVDVSTREAYRRAVAYLTASSTDRFYVAGPNAGALRLVSINRFRRDIYVLSAALLRSSGGWESQRR